MNTITIGLPVLPYLNTDENEGFLMDRETNLAVKMRAMTLAEVNDLGVKVGAVAIQLDADLIDNNALWDEGTLMIQHIYNVISQADVLTPGEDDAPDLFGNGAEYILIELDLTGGPQ